MQSGEWGAAWTRQQDRRANTVSSRAERIIYTTTFLSTSTKDAGAGAITWNTGTDNITVRVRVHVRVRMRFKFVCS